MAPARVLVTGATGLIGSALVPALTAAGASVVRLGRRPPPAPGSPGAPAAGASTWLAWDPERGSIPRTALQGVDAAVHLAGESLASGRWSRERKGRLIASRVRGTRLLSETLAGLDPPPRVLVSASAIGIYGDRGGERLTESSPAGSGFLPGLVTAWEQATGVAEAGGIRVVHLRTALVLAARGGVLARLRLPFALGLGGPLGSGRQWMSWITLDDLLRVIELALSSGVLAGPVNAAAPGAVTNLEFTRSLARVMGRPGFARVPAAVLRLVLGEMADEALLASTRVEPERLLSAGFAFRHPALEPALRGLLGRPSRAPGPAG